MVGVHVGKDKRSHHLANGRQNGAEPRAAHIIDQSLFKITLTYHKQNLRIFKVGGHFDRKTIH